MNHPLASCRCFIHTFDEDRIIANAELSFGAAAIMMGSTRRDPSITWSADRMGVYVHVSEAEVHYARAKAAGAEIAGDLQDTPHAQIALFRLICASVDPVSEVMESLPDSVEVPQIDAIRNAKLSEYIASQRLELAAALADRGRTMAAVREWRAALQDMPEHAEANRLLGQLYQQAGHVEAAIGHYEQSLATRNDQPRVLIKLGMLWESEGKLAEANNCFMRAIQADPRLVEEIRRRHVRPVR